MAQEIWCPYMVGLVIAVDGEADPNEYYRGTRWTRIAEGRVLVGIGTGTDSSKATRTFTSGDNPGEYAHADTVAEMPSHAHDHMGWWRVASDAGSGATYARDCLSSVRVPSDGRQYGVEAAGGGQPHNNVQPTYGVNYWRRDA